MLTRRLDTNWDMTFGHGQDDYLSDAQAIGQNVKSRLLLVLGEWFLDVTDGMPWNILLGTKPANPIGLEAAVRQRILDTYGVTAITAFSLTFNTASRKVTIAVTVQTIYATQVEIQVTGI